MAELILTPEEQATHSWLELPDETVGKLTKRTAMGFVEHDDEHGRIAGGAALLILTGMCHDRGENGLVVNIKHTTAAGEPTGDWRVTIERIG